ncbi:CRISPR-associated TM1812 family protein [Gloeomargarita lithophora Alchichica-D10]|uniref:CRISPR-associated TM1812 family protein n=1 Tax=Gloeomargarita lithophora Alchichica-D10 TaxID=1188229 RepID=A0A1J0AAI6_9CYAN|nr:TIGR02221 family CRISPR-associated protein [Gloeomargarita lithophora]APB32948.1 CRISPR-associated TM1812 family protein [Gloeomargarita lithophora Alchichica-D10]
MTKTLLTTIGTGNYSETIYHLADQKAAKTCYVAQAFCQIFAIEKVIILVTAEARQKHWESLKSCLPPTVQVQDHSIPSGETEEAIWSIFETLVDSIAPQDEIIFDITHAFRSIPVLVLLGAALLRKAKNVEIQGLYYGLYRSEASQSPIVDLTPALRLLDWLTATDKFISTGSAVELGNLLRTVNRDFYRSQRPGKHDPRPVNLQNFGRAIEDVSRSIELIRPISLTQEDLPKLIHESTDELSQEVGIFAKPFGLMLEQVRQSYMPLALSDDSTNKTEQIYKQFLLLRWYVDKQFTVHALLMAREWVVSALCLLDGREDYLKREHREAIENQLNSIRFPRNNPALNHPVAAHVENVKTLADFWGRLGDYRNDIAHVQMNESPLNSQTLEKFALKELLPTLQSLFPSLTRPLSLEEDD